jgi:DNA-binding Xre family transcriptional regulator
MTKLTPEACRAARAILKWSVRDLADEAEIAFSTVHLLEKGRPIRETTKEAIVLAFEKHNVEITNGDGTGARLKLSGNQE